MLDFENSLIENTFTNFNKILKQDDKIIDILPNSSSEVLGKLKWKVLNMKKYEYYKLLK